MTSPATPFNEPESTPLPGADPAARARLLERVDVPGAFATLLEAGPGYGKSKLLKLWRERLTGRGESVVLLGLDRECSDVRVFFDELQRACDEQLGSTEGPIRWVAARPGRSFRQLGAHFKRQCARVTLMLDQYERVESPALDRAIADLTTGANGGVHLVIASRRKIRVPFGERHLGGGIAYLHADDLRYHEGEIRELLSNELTPPDLEGVLAWSEGWPIAVHQAQCAASLDNRGAAILRLRLSQAEIQMGRYIGDEIIGALSPTHHRLLMETSIVDCFSVELAESITDMPDAWRILQDMRAEGLVTVGGTEENRQYRCHALVRQVLLAELRAQGKQAVSRKRLPAIRWLQQHGDLIGAIRQAHAAGEVELVASLVLTLDATMFGAIYGAAELSAVMEHVSADSLHRFPRLVLAKAYLEAKAGNVDGAADIVRSVRANAAARISGEDHRLLIRDLAIAESVIAMYNGRGLLRSDLGTVRTIQENCVDDENARAVINNFLCIIAFNSSEFPEALSRCESALHGFVGQKAQNGLGYIHIHMGRIFAEMGESDKAIQHYLDSRDHFLLRTAGDSRSTSLAAIFLAQTLYDRGQIDEALLSCASFSREGEHYGFYSEGVYAGYRTLAMIKKLTAGLPEAMQELDHGVAFARARRNVNLERLLVLEQLLLDADNFPARALQCTSLLSPPADAMDCDGDPWRVRDLRAMVRSRLATAQSDFDSAVEILDEQAFECERQGRTRTLIDLLVRLAILHETRRQRETALATMRRAVGLAWKGAIIAPFVEGGIDAVSLLALLVNSAALKHASASEVAFVHQTLRRCGMFGAKAASVLSRRELDVLQYLCRGMNNKAIARVLDISPETVRFHLKAIYQKFGVKSGRANRCVVADFAAIRELIPD